MVALTALSAILLGTSSATASLLERQDDGVICPGECGPLYAAFEDLPQTCNSTSAEADVNGCIEVMCTTETTAALNPCQACIVATGDWEGDEQAYSTGVFTQFTQLCSAFTSGTLVLAADGSYNITQSSESLAEESSGSSDAAATADASKQSTTGASGTSVAHGSSASKSGTASAAAANTSTTSNSAAGLGVPSLVLLLGAGAALLI